MANIHFENNGKHLHQDELMDSGSRVVAAMLLSFVHQCEKRLEGVVCPLHGEQPTVRFNGPNAVLLECEVEGCCEHLVKWAILRLKECWFVRGNDMTESTENSRRDPDSGKRPTVLVADPDLLATDPLVRLLRQADYDILTASDGLDTVAVFERHADEIVAVLMDKNIPGDCGDEIFDDLQRIRPNIPVIMMSGFTERDALGRFLGKGVVGILKKPFGPRTLIDTVRSVVDQSVA